MAKTIGILTFGRTTNFGGILQAYALQSVLKEMGFSPEQIDYFISTDNRDKSLYKWLRSSIWKTVSERIPTRKIRDSNIKSFKKQHFNMSDKHYSNPKELYENPPSYDAYIVGSDQVWNPRYAELDPAWFLTFGQPKHRRISYAASFGVSEIGPKHASFYAKWINKFDYLSVREVEGQEIINRLTGRHAKVVLDPTLLLNRAKWSNSSTPRPIDEPYVLCYYLPSTKQMEDAINRLATQVARRKGLKIVWIGQKEYMQLHPFRKGFFTAGPREFLSLFENADFVVTNSFHGTAFAINFSKPFLSIENHIKASGMNANSRQKSLLDKLNLTSRLVNVTQSVQPDYNLDIDYSHVTKILEQEKKKSLEFLQQALRGI